MSYCFFHRPILAALILWDALIGPLCPTVHAQDSQTLKNVQVFPKDITRPELIDRMRHFSFALDVRYQYCHIGGDGVSFDGVVFESDYDPDKVKAKRKTRL